MTIDADGQHTYEDTIKCLEAFLKSPDSLVLRVRVFEENVPLRSKFGNLLTRDVLGAFTGMAISDTQTDLRVIPYHWLRTLFELEGERYEFEMNMLLQAKEDGIAILEVPITTIYLDDDQSSHFHAIRDSIRIYAVFFKYIVSSVFSFLVDIVVFTILVSLFKGVSLESITLASVMSRAVSSVTNFLINHKLVFKAGNSLSWVKYFSLVVIQIFLSSVLVTLLSSWWTFPITGIKILVDGFLFFLSYYIQKTFVFDGGKR